MYTVPGSVRLSTNVARAAEQRRVLLALDGRCRRTLGAVSVAVMTLTPAAAATACDDVVVPGAAAEVALEALANRRLVGRRTALDQADRGEHHARRAVAALERVMVVERLLDRMELAVRREPLDRGDLHAVGLDAEHRAGLHRLAVHEHRARAARRRVAADVRPGEPEALAEHVRRAAPAARARARARTPLTVSATRRIDPPFPSSSASVVRPRRSASVAEKRARRRARWSRSTSRRGRRAGARRLARSNAVRPRRTRATVEADWSTGGGKPRTWPGSSPTLDGEDVRRRSSGSSAGTHHPESGDRRGLRRSPTHRGRGVGGRARRQSSRAGRRARGCAPFDASWREDDAASAAPGRSAAATARSGGTRARARPDAIDAPRSTHPRASRS